MIHLLKFTALIEATTGVALITAPSLVVQALLRSPLIDPVGDTLGRIAGAALLTLGIACWLGSKDMHPLAARGLVTAMTLYNGMVSVLLFYAGFFLGQAGIALWPAIILHAAMVPWCITTNRTLNSGARI